MIDIEDRFIEKRIFKSRLILIYLFFALLFALLVYRTYSLQVLVKNMFYIQVRQRVMQRINK